MHPRIKEALDFLDQNHAAFHETVAAIAPASRETRPAENRWSVAEIVQHLALIESRLAGLLGAKLTEAQRAGLPKETETTPIVNPADVATITDRSRKATAPETAIPKPGI